MTDAPSKPEKFRAFIALSLTNDGLDRLKAVIRPLKRHFEHKNIRWVPGQNFHITLAFLGHIPRFDIPALESLMAGVSAATKVFPVAVGPVTLFPNPKKAGLLVADVVLDAPLADLQARLYAALISDGYQLEDRPYRPHITIARLKKTVITELPPVTDTAPVLNPITGIHLYQSESAVGGVVYSILKTELLTGKGKAAY
ncbi:MAG: RNA 2',3'-cyclic phosphodiesterase [Alphaproteobacteria bacterium]|nr:MAG: RNA 2',3'-cyclic phosphodiesterase [Alphaproteobacteria bacterium]